MVEVWFGKMFLVFIEAIKIEVRKEGSNKTTKNYYNYSYHDHNNYYNNNHNNYSMK